MRRFQAGFIACHNYTCGCLQRISSDGAEAVALALFACHTMTILPRLEAWLRP